MSLLLLFALLVLPAPLQDPPDPNYLRGQVFASFDAFEAALEQAAGLEDASEREARLDELFEELEEAGQIPYAHGRQVAFMYRGPATSVAFPGDHTGWSPQAAAANRVGLSDVWKRTFTFVADSRVDYKVVRDGSWILDPSNPLQVWSGFGPNSELRMPEYRYPHETVIRPDGPQGTLSSQILIHSSSLGYDVYFRIYLPPGEAPEHGLPTVYFTDGHEYAAHHLGSAVAVLDNLIAARRLRACAAVFIDPRDPHTGENRRAEQYIANPAFADFVALELIPSVETSFPLRAEADQRAILGTSLGGLFSAYLGTRHPEAVSNLAIQSPAFQVYPDIYALYQNSTKLPALLRIYMESGTIFDGQGGSNLAAILQARGYDHAFETVHEGHSWGHWRGKLDDALLYLIGAP